VIIAIPGDYIGGAPVNMVNPEVLAPPINDNS
jgi:hypothetical protein